MRPESLGTITLRSKDPWDKPIIDAKSVSSLQLHLFYPDDVDYRALESESDMNILVRATQFILRLARTKELTRVLDVQEHSTDQSTVWWPGDANPDKVG